MQRCSEEEHRLLAKCQQVNPPFGDIVRLNVGGKSFKTNRHTLTKHHDSLLARLFSDLSFSLKKCPDGSFFLDRDADIFSFILTFLRR